MRWGPVLIIGVCTILSILLLCIRPLKENFQDYKILNVDYNKEVYLVGLPGAAPSYTYDDAVTKCNSLGGTLATRAQLTTAQVLGAEGCKNGAWVADDKTALYYPSQASTTNPACAGVGIGVQTMAPTDGKGYATCYGKKPETGEFGIQFFAPNIPSVFDTALIQRIISGDGTGPADQNSPDLFTQEITAAQALFAAERAGPGATATNNWRVARQYIVDNWQTLNTQIRGTDPAPEEAPSAWINAKAKSCQALDKIQNELIDKHKALKGAYAYLQRLTAGTQGAKNESMNFQRDIAYVCRGATPDTSPACKRLAELDYAVLYADPTGSGSLFKGLDNLNAMLAMRECELQTGLTALQKLMDTLKCGEAPINLPFKTDVLGNFKSGNKYYDCVNNDARDKNYTAQFPDRMSAESIGFIPSEDLKKALEEISPFFTSPGYATLFDGILNQLSVLLRIPELNDYTTAKQNLETNIPKRMETIAAATNRLWAP